jgi:O-antigen/teichoic acid export membrane protein
MILISVTLTSSNQTIGYFAIAMSFALISDTFFPVVESRMFNKIHSLNANQISRNLSPLNVAIKEIIASQLIFIFLAFALPMVYGAEYAPSIYFAIVLIFVKCMYSIVKVCSSYAIISNRFDIHIILNLIYILMYIFLFYVTHAFNFQGAWQIASLLTSFLAASVGLFLTRGLAPKRITLPTDQRNSGSELV